MGIDVVHIKSQKDFFSGLLFIVLGAGFGWGALGYRMGTSAHMGPGYFPLLCSILLASIGLILCIKSVTLRQGGERIGAWRWRPVLYVVLANVLFGVLLGGWPTLGIPAFGLLFATFVLIVVAARAGSEFRWGEALILAAILTAGSWLVFVWGLGMPFLTWPPFLGT
ncbi:tripartite tricarboxylate transporter TctB family protein [Castellaniella sp.]|uniref:tripartite tricarboxylate transporter TctB family protein n=1 Tax=Castellaniella sp. TaxID=1955812 RepID=UPI003567D933